MMNQVMDLEVSKIVKDRKFESLSDPCSSDHSVVNILE